jgi:glycosyltransferase involved in cell wall biosynthesis
MRLAFDLTSCTKPHRGGIATYGWELVRAVARAAPEHELVLGVRPNRWLRRRLLDALLADLRPGTSARLLLDPWVDARLQRPDVLHSVGVRLPPLGAAPRSARVVTVHDVNVFEFPELSEEVWRAERQERIRQTLARADLVIAYSEQGRAALAEHVAFPSDRVRVVPCGVDTAYFARPNEPTLRATLQRHDLLGADGAPRPYVLLIGESSARKNQAGLLAAFARAVAERALPDEWLLVFAGPREQAAAALREMARREGLPANRLLLPGWVPDADLPALLAGAALYVCASLHEGFGLPVLEAQACGAPVLCSNRGALPETLGDCGVLFDPADADAFATALLGLLHDAPRRAKLARAGPARVAEKFAWAKVAERTLAVHAEAAGSAARGAG